MPSDNWRTLSGFAKYVVAVRDMSKDGLVAADVAVLFALASHMNQEKERCYPTQPDLAKESGCGLTVLKRSLKKLCRLGLVRIDNGPNARHLPSDYYLNLEAMDVYPKLIAPGPVVRRVTTRQSDGRLAASQTGDRPLVRRVTTQEQGKDNLKNYSKDFAELLRSLGSGSR